MASVLAAPWQLGVKAWKRFLVLFRIIEQDPELVKKKLKISFNHFKNCSP